MLVLGQFKWNWQFFSLLIHLSDQIAQFRLCRSYQHWSRSIITLAIPWVSFRGKNAHLFKGAPRNFRKRNKKLKNRFLIFWLPSSSLGWPWYRFTFSKLPFLRFSCCSNTSTLSTTYYWIVCRLAKWLVAGLYFSRDLVRSSTTFMWMSARRMGSFCEWLNCFPDATNTPTSSIAMEYLHGNAKLYEAAGGRGSGWNQSELPSFGSTKYELCNRRRQYIYMHICSPWKIRLKILTTRITEENRF